VLVERYGIEENKMKILIKTLPDVDFSISNLFKTSLPDVNLRGACLEGVDLSDTKLYSMKSTFLAGFRAWRKNE
jgi:uncharacterized protein YjbI with pentapeptide repeats